MSPIAAARTLPDQGTPTIQTATLTPPVPINRAVFIQTIVNARGGLRTHRCFMVLGLGIAVVNVGPSNIVATGGPAVIVDSATEAEIRGFAAYDLLATNATCGTPIRR